MLARSPWLERTGGTAASAVCQALPLAQRYGATSRRLICVSSAVGWPSLDTSELTSWPPTRRGISSNSACASDQLSPTVNGLPPGKALAIASVDALTKIRPVRATIAMPMTTTTATRSSAQDTGPGDPAPVNMSRQAQPGGHHDQRHSSGAELRQLIPPVVPTTKSSTASASPAVSNASAVRVSFRRRPTLEA